VTSPVRTASAPPVPDRQHARPARAFRADIQGLRAIAVSLVLLFHLWPNRLGGGFVGVDVFFVISGFLITSHLYSRPPRTARDLAAFWSHRIRRLLPASLLVRPAPQVAALATADGAGAPEVQWTAAQAFKTPQFITLALAHFACCAAHSGPIFHMVSYAMVCGIAPLTAVTVYSLAGFSGLGGRLLLGALADRLGAKQVLVGGLFVQALSVATYLAVGQLGEFYALSVVFGLAYGGVMPLYAVLVREYFGARIMGTVFGAVSAFASLGMALGPLAGGWVFDTFHAYNWLYVGSFAIGIAAVAVALSFPSAKRPSQPSLDLGRAAA